jgi:hypothetical protein
VSIRSDADAAGEPQRLFDFVDPANVGVDQRGGAIAGFMIVKLVSSGPMRANTDLLTWWSSSLATDMDWPAAFKRWIAAVDERRDLTEGHEAHEVQSSIYPNLVSRDLHLLFSLPSLVDQNGWQVLFAYSTRNSERT